MYMDLIVVLIVIIIGLVKYKAFSSYIYLLCASDILFRVLTFFNENVKMGEINDIISKYIPASLYSVIVRYTSDFIQTILVWAYVIVFAIFLYYTIRILLKKR